MKIYSLKDIESIILNSSLLLAKKSQNQKDLLIDKHNFVLNLITTKNVALDNPTHYFSNIKSVTLKRALGDRYYIIILDNLEQLGLIQINDTYSSDLFSKSYCILKSIIEKHPLIRTEVKSIRF
jgi:hypothetical protein